MDEIPFQRLMNDLRDGDPNAAREVFEKFTRRLAGLAAANLPDMIKPKVDPEDIAQSVLRTFFRRHVEGQFEPKNWDNLWTLLAKIAIRKCGHQIEHLYAARRDVRRDASPPSTSPDQSTLSWVPADPSPSPEEAAVFTETMQLVLGQLDDRERPIVELRLQGFDIAEIARQVGRSQRTVHRLLDGVRARLEHLT